jgi:hypothetical protein
MLFPVLLVAFVVALASGSTFLRAKKEGTNYDGPITLGRLTYASRSELILSGRRCGTKSLTEAEKFEMEQKLAAVPHLTAADNTRQVATITIQFHVIRGVDQDGNLNPGIINNQIAVLNNAFAPSNISFVLGGTTVTDNADWFLCGMGTPEEAAMKAALRTGGADTLNVYTAIAQGVLGWATPPLYYANSPSYDGVVIQPSTLPGGNFAPYNQGMTLVHEVGHWLGLEHTFEGGCAKYGKQGDGVRDTPAEAGPNYGCPTTPVNSCKGKYYQLAGSDPVHNYMEYTDDSCMTEFTMGQSKRMRQAWKAFREGK